MRMPLSLFLSKPPLMIMLLRIMDHGPLILLPTEGTVISCPCCSHVLDAVHAAEKWLSVLNVRKRVDIEFVTLKNGQRTLFSETEQLINGNVVCILPLSELVSLKYKGMTLK